MKYHLQYGCAGAMQFLCVIVGGRWSLLACRGIEAGLDGLWRLADGTFKGRGRRDDQEITKEEAVMILFQCQT